MKTVAYKGAKGDQLRIYWKDHVKRSADLSFRSRYSVCCAGIAMKMEGKGHLGYLWR